MHGKRQTFHECGPNKVFQPTGRASGGPGGGAPALGMESKAQEELIEAAARAELEGRRWPKPNWRGLLTGLAPWLIVLAVILVVKLFTFGG
jgi:hypothetical protein